MIQKLYGTVAVAALTALLAIQVSAQTTTTQSNTAAQTQAEPAPVVAAPGPIPAPAETATPEPIPVPTPSATTTVEPSQSVAEPTPVIVDAGPGPGSVEDFIKNVGDTLFFDFDKHDLKGKDIEDLDKMIAWLKQYPKYGITVEGHCDERGTREYNLALGERRADAVKSYLISKGINPTRIQTVSYGKERPAVLGANELAWTFNRRAVLVLY